MSLEPFVLAVDPGREKTGVAIMNFQKELIMMDILPTDSIRYGIESLLLTYPQVSHIVCGKGTNHKAVGTIIENLCVEHNKVFAFVNEMHTTEEARRRYFDMYPPRGWRKFIPTGMLYPPTPVDDITAWIIGERWLLEIMEKE